MEEINGEKRRTCVILETITFKIKRKKYLQVQVNKTEQRQIKEKTTNNNKNLFMH